MTNKNTIPTNFREVILDNNLTATHCRKSKTEMSVKFFCENENTLVLFNPI